MPSSDNKEATPKGRGLHIRWMSWIPKIVVAFGLYVLTQSFFMTLGIMILIVVAVELVEYFIERKSIGL